MQGYLRSYFVWAVWDISFPSFLEICFWEMSLEEAEVLISVRHYGRSWFLYLFLHPPCPVITEMCSRTVQLRCVRCVEQSVLPLTYRVLLTASGFIWKEMPWKRAELASPAAHQVMHTDNISNFC